MNDSGRYAIEIRMEKTLKVVGKLKKRGIILDYAIGGGIAALYYIEPLLTYDLDIFFVPVEDKIAVLAPLYRWLSDKGYGYEREHIVIEGVPVQFIPVYNDLVREAVGTAREVKYGGTRTKVLGREFLVAVMLQTYRPKDKERLARIFEESKPDGRKLLGILKRHGLIDRYREFQEKNLGKK